jgi:hypothetical protein
MVETIPGISFSTQIEQHLRRAAEVLRQHRCNDGRCAACGCDFPCAFAVLAEHNLAL